jgi:hypothetical protein
MAAFFIARSRRRSMLTVKVMSPSGGEEIHCGLSVGFNPNQQSIAVSGMDQNVFLKQGEVVRDERKRQDHFTLRTPGTTVGITEALQRRLR